MITNQTKKFKIINKARIYKNIFGKAFGLMFKFRKPDFGLVFVFDKEQHTPLHMWFVFFPIDVLFLDKNNKVVDIKKNFKPWSYYSPKAVSEYVIELPVGLLKNTELGDRIEFE